MKTFLQSAIDCFEIKHSRTLDAYITDDEQSDICLQFYDASCGERFGNEVTNESSVYFLLFIAAERGELR